MLLASADVQLQTVMSDPSITCLMERGGSGKQFCIVNLVASSITSLASRSLNFS